MNILFSTQPSRSYHFPMPLSVDDSIYQKSAILKKNDMINFIDAVYGKILLFWLAYQTYIALDMS